MVRIHYWRDYGTHNGVDILQSQIMTLEVGYSHLLYKEEEFWQFSFTDNALVVEFFKPHTIVLESLIRHKTKTLNLFCQWLSSCLPIALALVTIRNCFDISIHI